MYDYPVEHYLKYQYSHDWKAGDPMLFDQTQVMHKRSQPFPTKENGEQQDRLLWRGIFYYEGANRDSDIEWVSMDFQVPVNAILREYNSVKDSLNIQRPEYDHKDWYAVTLYGYGSDKTKVIGNIDKKECDPFWSR